MTLAKTWSNCLKMWKCISSQIDEDFNALSPRDKFLKINDLKESWLEINDPDTSLLNDCYFCDYHWETATRKQDRCFSPRSSGCIYCPARTVDPTFDCCDTPYDYSLNPKGFYKKIVALNKKHIAAKRKHKK